MALTACPVQVATCSSAAQPSRQQQQQRRPALGAWQQRRRAATAAPAATPLGLAAVLAELPAQASEAFIDTTAGLSDAAADAAADAVAAFGGADALAAAQAAAADDPTDLVFTALFTIASALPLPCHAALDCAPCSLGAWPPCSAGVPCGRTSCATVVALLRPDPPPALPALPAPRRPRSWRAERGDPGGGLPVVHFVERQPP